MDHSVRGEGDFNEQERRTLENATTGWWKSNVLDIYLSLCCVVSSHTQETTQHNDKHESSTLDFYHHIHRKRHNIMINKYQVH
jgi:hypothetical protein